MPAHTRLSWVMECLTGYGEAARMTQFKDKSQRAGADRVGVGLFTYPILQVADILVYQANSVPVGEDQRQHIELTRNLAQRFNSRYGETFVVPDAYILPAAAKVLDLQEPTAKMSKSLPDAGTVNLLDDPKVIEKKIKRAVTDTDTEIRFDPETKPGVSNLLNIYASFTDCSAAEAEAEFAGQGYGALKVATAEAVVAFAEPFARRVAELMADRGELARVLARGAARANEVADESVRRAYDAVGFVPALVT